MKKVYNPPKYHIIKKVGAGKINNNLHLTILYIRNSKKMHTFRILPITSFKIKFLNQTCFSSKMFNSSTTKEFKWVGGGKIKVLRQFKVFLVWKFDFLFVTLK